MTNIIPTPEPVTPTAVAPADKTVSPWSLAGAKKAYAGGIAGAISVGGTISIAPLFTTGHLDVSALGLDIAAVVVGFGLGFFGAWLPKNAA